MVNMKRLIKARVKPSKCEFEKSNNRGEVIKQFVSIGTLILTFTTFLLSTYNTYMNMYTPDPLYVRSIYSSNVDDEEFVLEDIVYSIDSISEINRYCVKEFVPLLYVYIEEDNKIIGERFLELPHLYSTINIESETSVFMFCDFKIESGTYDDFCRYISTQYNRKGCNINMNSKIIYYVKADYLYINDNRKSKDFIISRYSNSINPFTESKLYFDDDLLKTFQRSKQHNTVECSKALYEFEKIYYEPEPSCFRDPDKELLDDLNHDVYSFITKIQSEYSLDLSDEQYDNRFSLS